jgi:hypothetical protein
MFFRSLLTPLKSRPPVTTFRRSHRTRTPRLAVEVLDDRCLPSTFTVTNLLDSGAGSLRAAVADANANSGTDTIDFATTGTIGLTSGQLDITDSLTIRGPGAGALTVSGNHNSRVFGIAGAPTVVIAGLTVANGSTTDSPGGGLSMAGGTVTLDHVTVSGNYAGGVTGYGGNGRGGGLYVAGGTLTLDHCTVRWNYAIGASGLDGEGLGSSGGSGGDGAGGGLYIAGGTARVNQTIISENRAAGGAGGSVPALDTPNFFTFGGNGGYGQGGGIYVAAGRLEVRGSMVSGNTAAGGYGGSGDVSGYAGVGEGGGLYAASAYPALADLDTFTVSNTINNVADIDPNISGPFTVNGAVYPALAISNGSTQEGNNGTHAIIFTVSVSVASNQPITVAYATADGTATAGSDYQAASGTLTIPAGQTTGTITVWVNGDRLVEANETFFVNLSSPTNATIADGQGVGSIGDDEPRISIGSYVTKAEGRKGQTTLFTFTVTLSTAYDQAVTMSFQTENGNATTSDKDYVAKSGTLTFAPGETTKTITIVVNGDNKREADEYFYVGLFGNSSNSLFNNTWGVGTILNDD